MKHINLIVIPIVAVGGLYTAASWWIGGAVEQRLDQSERRVVAAYPDLAIVSRDYHRGLFNSTEDVTYGIGASAAGQLMRNRVFQAMPGVTADALRLTSHLAIHHGPLPQLRALGLATIDTQLQTPPVLQKVLGPLLHGAPILQAHTLIDFQGVSTAEVRSPSFQYQAPDGVTLMWGGLTGSGRTTGALAAWSGTLTMPGMTIKGPQGHLELHDLSFSADMQRAFDVLYVGHTAVHLKTLSAQTPDGKSVSMAGVSLGSDSVLKDEYIDEHAVISMDSLDVAPFAFSRVGYSQSFSHLHGESLAALVTAMRNAQGQMRVPGAPPADVARANLALFGRYASEVALHEPVLQIERLGFFTPEGEFRLSARIAMPGLTRNEMQGPLGMFALARHLDASADLRVDAAVLDKFLDASGRREQIEPQLQQLEQQGYLRRDGSAFVTTITFRSGALLVNGQPFRRNPAVAPH